MAQKKQLLPPHRLPLGMGRVAKPTVRAVKSPKPFQLRADWREV